MDHPQLQPAIALCFLYSGIVMGICYGILDRVRHAVRNAVLQNIIDFLLAVFFFGLFSFTLFITTGGTIRFYPFLMTAVGFCLERTTVHAAVLSIRSKRIHKSASHSS